MRSLDLSIAFEKKAITNMNALKTSYEVGGKLFVGTS